MTGGSGFGSPYVGLSPFEASDRQLFFGRQREVEIVTANLAAFRLTVLYGPGGSGKTSLLRAGLLGRQDPSRGEEAVVVFDAWHEPDLRRALIDAVSRTLDPQGCPHTEGDGTLAGVLGMSGPPLGIALDQFEGYFVYHPHGDHVFEDELAAAVRDPQVPANFLISIREDSVGRLAQLAPRITGLLDNMLRLGFLDEAAAREVIVKPLRQWEALTGNRVEIDEKLIERVLEEVGVAGIADGRHYHPTVLQIVMRRLWEEASAEGAERLRVSSFYRLGGARGLLESSIEEPLANMTPKQQLGAMEVLDRLITPTGERILLSRSDLAHYIDDDVEVHDVLHRLTEFGILRTVQRGEDALYAVGSDLLGGVARAWSARARLAHRDRRSRRLLLLLTSGLTLLAAVLAVLLLASST